MPVNGSHTAPVDTRDELRGPAPFRDRRLHDLTPGAENDRERHVDTALPSKAGNAAAPGVEMTEPTEAPFEKTFRLVCRLDDADIDYVRDTAEWIRRCVARTLQLNPSTHADDVTPIVVDMSTRGRWRLMRPETVAEQLALPVPQTAPETDRAGLAESS